jgi:alanyl-tRNA synthetase
MQDNPMTDRLYYDDAYLRQFTARVTERLTVDGHPAVVLDRSAFYPTGGGQPGDTGKLNAVNVIDVQQRKADHAVVHVLDTPLDADEVEGVIDWARRFDHMQQHTGQHILTQAFVQTSGAGTVGFHLSADSVTIDLDRVELPPEAFIMAEELANAIVFENRPVSVRYVNPDEAEGIRVRRLPDALATGGLRVVEIGDFDVTACGGTHVSATGAIGMIKIIKTEKRGDKTRVEFKCGGRAFTDYRIRTAVLNHLTPVLNCGFWEVDTAVLRLIDQLQNTQRSLRQAQVRLTEYDAQVLLASVEPENGLRTIKLVVDYDLDQARLLAQTLASQPGIMVLIGIPGERAHLIMARSPNLPYDMNEGLKRALNILGGGRGGGQPEFVQGGGLSADGPALTRALDAAAQALLWL